MENERKKPDAMEKALVFFFLKEFLKPKCAELSASRQAQQPSTGKRHRPRNDVGSQHGYNSRL